MHTAHFKHPTLHCKLQQDTTHCKLETAHFTLQPNPTHCKLQTAHCTLQTWNSTLHTAHFNRTLHTAHHHCVPWFTVGRKEWVQSHCFLSTFPGADLNTKPTLVNYSLLLQRLRPHQPTQIFTRSWTWKPNPQLSVTHSYLKEPYSSRN